MYGFKGVFHTIFKFFWRKQLAEKINFNKKYHIWVEVVESYGTIQ